MIVKARKQTINNPQNVHEVLSRVLATENEVDRMKEHFWIYTITICQEVRIFYSLPKPSPAKQINVKERQFRQLFLPSDNKSYVNLARCGIFKRPLFASLVKSLHDSPNIQPFNGKQTLRTKLISAII